MTRTVAALLLSLSLLLSGTATASALVDEEMSDAEAGRVYLDAVCPANDASDTFYRVIWRGRKTIPWAELNRRMPEVRRLSKAFGRATARGSRQLFSPPAAWPSDVDSLVTRIANTYAKESYWLMAMAEATTGREWDRYWTRYGKIRSGTASAEVRARLGLPPNGQGC